MAQVRVIHEGNSHSMARQMSYSIVQTIVSIEDTREVSLNNMYSKIFVVAVGECPHKLIKQTEHL